jgi:hypothetical protein
VTIKVTPRSLASTADNWEFTIVFDTHSQDLSDDLLKSARLLDGVGGQQSPMAWEGAPPGGHHREGVLRFKPRSRRSRKRLNCNLRAPEKVRRGHSAGNSNEIAAPRLSFHPMKGVDSCTDSALS